MEQYIKDYKMKPKKFRQLGCVVMLGACFIGLSPIISASSAKNKFLIHENDRVVFWGDSITDGAPYPVSIANYINSHYPEWKPRFYNLGWWGDCVNPARMQRDLVPLKPTLVFIMLGQNDGRGKKFDGKIFEKYINGYKELIKTLRDNTKARIILITPTPYHARVHPEKKFYVETMRKFADGVKKLAEMEKLPCIDLFKSYTDYIVEYNRLHPDFLFSKDDTHPNVSGQALMAYCLLKGMDANGLISILDIDADSKTIKKSECCKVKNLKVQGNKITFTRDCPATPMLFSYEKNAKLDLEPFYKDLNKDIMKISGLKKPFYRLSIGNTWIGVFSRDELEKGINLGTVRNTPQMRQAETIDFINNQRQVFFKKWWRDEMLAGYKMCFDVAAKYHSENLMSRYLRAQEDACFKTMDRYAPFPPQNFVIEGIDKDFLGYFKPYPRIGEEVQIIIEVDAGPWKNIKVDEKHASVSFVPPLKLQISGYFACGAPGSVPNGFVEMRDDGKNGDAVAGDMIYTYVFNIYKRKKKYFEISFDDGSSFRKNGRSALMQKITRDLSKTIGEKFAGPKIRIVPRKDSRITIDEKSFESVLGQFHQPSSR